MVDKNGLTTTDRKEYSRLIKSRQTTMIKALDTELTGDVDTIVEDIRYKKGITRSVSELREGAKLLDVKIREEVREGLSNEQRRIKVAKIEVDEKFSDEEEAIKKRFKEELRGVAEKKAKEKSALSEELKNAEEKIKLEKVPEELKKLSTLRRELAEAEEIDSQIRADATRRSTVIRKSKGRIENLINDSANRSLEALWFIETREEAKELIEKIPTVSEAIDLCQTEDGLNNLMKRIDPNTKLLAAPKREEPEEPEEPEEEDENLETVEAEFSVIDNEEDDDDEDDNIDYELDEVADEVMAETGESRRRTRRW